MFLRWKTRKLPKLTKRWIGQYNREAEGLLHSAVVVASERVTRSCPTSQDNRGRDDGACSWTHALQRLRYYLCMASHDNGSSGTWHQFKKTRSTGAGRETIKRFAKGDKPFFVHLCYTAPHFPLHAFAEDIDRYRGKYSDGYLAMREQRHKRQAKLGLFTSLPKLSAEEDKKGDYRYDYDVPDWKALPAAERKREEARMETYAAMVDRMDRGIGRVLAALDEAGVVDNTRYTMYDAKSRRCEIDSSMWTMQSWLLCADRFPSCANNPPYPATEENRHDRYPSSDAAAVVQLSLRSRCRG